MDECHICNPANNPLRRDNRSTIRNLSQLLLLHNDSVLIDVVLFEHIDGFDV